MSTEYRRGIPNTAHVEAATRLGLLWEESVEADRWRLEIRNGALFSDFAAADEGFTNWDRDLSRDRYSLDGYSLRPIRPDGTPVDWEVLDQEVARVGQRGQPQGFRADLWRRICRHFIGAETDTYNQVTFDDIVSLNDTACHFTRFFWDWRDVLGASAAQTDILARWTVYQELKPLYDLVDGAQGEAAMPRDVELEWNRHARPEQGWTLEECEGDWRLCFDDGLSATDGHATWRSYEGSYGVPLRNFVAVLDAVAECRVAERTRRQAQAPIVTSAQPEPRHQEVARVGQPSAQPQGFRADLWQSLCEVFSGLNLPSAAGRTDWGLSNIDSVSSDLVLIHGVRYRQVLRQASADILARWTVYQELKPLYDLVDGAQGEAAMPRDVTLAWRQHDSSRDEQLDRETWMLIRRKNLITTLEGGIADYSETETGRLDSPLRNFAAILDAVAERRVAVRVRGQTQAPTVTSAQPEPRRFADVRPDRHGWRWWLVGAENSDDGLFGVAEVNRRICVQNGRFYWLDRSHVFGEFTNLDHIWNRRTVIPTDEQGNPVSWEAIAPAGTVQSVNSDETVTVQDAATENEVQRVTLAVSRVVQQASQQILGTNVTVSPTGRIESTDAPDERSAIPSFSRGSYTISPGQFSNDFTASAPITPQTRALVEAQRAREEAETRARVLQQVRRGVERELSDSQAIIGADTGYVTVRNSDGVGLHDSLKQQPLPRFTADELDDVDHSKTTKLDEVTLRRGKLPTVEQIAKYREVRARRTGGSVADALKESRIDCEVAQYVLERWAGGLGDAQVLAVIEEVRFLDCAVDVDKRAAWFIGLTCGALDTSEKPSPTVQRERQEAEERRQRLARLSEQLRTERAANVETHEAEPNRFDLLEPDPTVDPAESIRTWEARRAAAAAVSRKVGQEARQPAQSVQPAHAEKPPAPKPRPVILVVDAEKDGLTWGEAGLALLGFKLNEAC